MIEFNYFLKLNSKLMSMFCNETILDGLSRRDPEVINKVYIENQQIITRWIKKVNGNEEDANDLLHDALLIILRKSKEEQINLTCSFSTYLVSICKHKWFHESRTRNRMVLSDTNTFSDIPNEEFDNSYELKYKLFKKFIGTLEKRERQFLTLCIQKKPLEEIMQRLGFKNKQAVADKKKNLIKKLRRILLSCAEYKDFRLEILDNY